MYMYIHVCIHVFLLYIHVHNKHGNMTKYSKRCHTQVSDHHDKYEHGLDVFVCG